MRKVISLLGLIAMLSLFSGSILAGQESQCDPLMDQGVTKGLYGLCIAWHNASNDNARKSIENSYSKKATGPNDPPLPGTGGFECPCWNMSDIVEAAATEFMLECQAIRGETFGEQFAIFGTVTFIPTQAFHVEDSACFHQNFTTGTNFVVPFDENTPPERIEACRTDIGTVCNG